MMYPPQELELARALCVRTPPYQGPKRYTSRAWALIATGFSLWGMAGEPTLPTQNSGEHSTMARYRTDRPESKAAT